MTHKPSTKTRILVAIASHGSVNDRHLAEMVQEFRSMPFDVHIVVLSDAPKKVAPAVELIVVDLRGKHPGSLPFSHKEIFAKRLEDYDLFIYSEDDILITEKNLRAFLELSSVLPSNEIPGFIRYEEGPNGDRNFPDVRGHFHWDPQSVRCRSGQIFAFLTNEHSACYVLTQQQLRCAIDSGGFLVGPHHGKYDRICSAATDPYTQCGLQKVICISCLEDFKIHHLSNKYVGTGFGISGQELSRQVDVLLRIGTNCHKPSSLFKTETKLMNAYYSKNYYEPVRPEILSMIPAGARSVLSIGCGWGAMETALVERGLRVAAIPLDPVIAEGAKVRGVEIVGGNLATARNALDGRSFDCLLLLDVLHLIPHPDDALASFAQLLRGGGMAIVQVPRVTRHTTIIRIIRGNQRLRDIGDYQKTGVHITSRRALRRWLANAGLKTDNTMKLLSPTAGKIPWPVQWVLNLARADEKIIVVAQKV